MRVFIANYALSEDVAAALDDKPSDYIDLDTMSTPQYLAVATEVTMEWLLALEGKVRAEYQALDEERTEYNLTWKSSVTEHSVTKRPVRCFRLHDNDSDYGGQAEMVAQIVIWEADTEDKLP